ncbi:unnamed protein product [Eruca vesicaria subsp. sativa]|uniref:NAC domain-containing protein n=1 Tax=Eruca vesicaria subsp. sativa TaxID=29727 RepID=A0ABC8M5T3_ERUVS|nr:unnamed protein product [Eruca vesicaria subsp. sativa]
MVTMRTYPPGSRFLPTELGLVKVHLKLKVDKNISGFIKTLNVYGDAPWRLEHDTNHLYPRNEWYYFVPRIIRGKKTVSRIVPSNGECLGGTWKSIGKKQEVKNRQDVLMGYKNELVFNKNVVVDGKSKQEKTDWHMDEYSLNRESGEFHDLILCHIRLLHSAERFKILAHHQVVENDNNNVLQNQDQQEEAVGFANHNDMTMVETNQLQQQQQQEQEQIFNQGNGVNQQQEQQDSLIPVQINNNNIEQQCPFAYQVAEEGDMTSGYDGLRQMFNQRNGVNQQQQHEQQQDSLIPLQNNNNNNIEQQFPYAYHGTEDDMTTGYDGLEQMFNQGNGVNQQQYSAALPLQTNNNNIEQQGPFAYHGAEEGNMTSGYYGLMEIFNQRNVVNQQQQHEQQQDSTDLPLQTNFNQLPISLDTRLVPSQLENHNNIILPNQEQKEEAGFANQQQQQEQEDSLIAFDDMIDVEELLKDLNQGIELQGIAFDDTIDVDELLKDLEDSPLPPLQSNDNHGLSPQLENHNNNTLLPNQEQKQEAGFANQQQHEQQKQESNENQEDIAFDDMIDVDELLKDLEDSLLPPLQSNENHGLSSQLENHNNNILPNQEQKQEAGFANQQQHEQQEQKREDSLTELWKILNGDDDDDDVNDDNGLVEK